MKIDLNDKITPHFTWSEALYCPQWNVHVFPLSEVEYNNIIQTCIVLEDIRKILNSPLKVTSFYRPKLYNKLISGASRSLHMAGQACDFVPTRVSVHKAKIALKDFLDDLNIRMENNNRGGWIHIDRGFPGRTGRFFKP